MATLSLSSYVSTFVAPQVEQFQCDQRSAAESALHELAGHVSALRLGLAPFDVLTPAERAEQLLALVDADRFIPVEQHVAKLTADQLMEIVADKATPTSLFIAAAREVTARIDAVPTPAERQQIESEDEQYHRELTLHREWEQAEYQLDAPLHGRTYASLG